MEKKKRSRGRPGTGRARPEKITLRLTAQEKALLKGRAEKRGQGLATYFLEASNFFEERS